MYLLDFPNTNDEKALLKAREDLAGRRLEKFVMTATALNCFLACPREFYFRNLLRVPTKQSEALCFGSSIHYALQRFFERMQRHPLKRFPSKVELLAEYKWHLNHQAHTFIKNAFERRLQYGEDVLGLYYDKYIGSWTRIVAVERNIQKVSVRGIPLRGKPDKLEFKGKEVNVVDYKTGNPERCTEKLSGPADNQHNGGDYWRQAVFYKILVDNYLLKKWNVVSTEFDFVEPATTGEFHKARIVIRPQDVETVTQQIMDAWARIRRREFDSDCGREGCRWCGKQGSAISRQPSAIS